MQTPAIWATEVYGNHTYQPENRQLVQQTEQI